MTQTDNYAYTSGVASDDREPPSQTGSRAMAADITNETDDDGRDEIQKRIDDRLTLDNIRKLMDQIEASIGEVEEEAYEDIVEQVRTWVIYTFAFSEVRS